jgi:peptidoglycan/xylan/chitin deacetylase (PgdA/CDA1 family)
MLEERSRSSSAADRIHFLGWRNDLPGIYAAADVFVLPSHREGVSSALLEAMSSALPSVAARVGGTGEVIAHEENGLLVDAERPSAWPAAVIRIARDAALRSRLGASARRTAEAHHARDAVFERYGHLRSIVSKPHFQKSFPILAYHRIRPRAQYGIDVTVDEFDRQLRWLREQGYRGISLRELYDTWSEGLPFPERSVVITFDDGHREICEHALPVMRRHGFRATLFVSPGLLGKEWWVGGRGPGRTTWHEERPDAYREGSPEWRRYSILSWSELEDLARDGMEIASHGWTHPFLTCLSDDDLDRELVASRQGLAAKLGTAIDFLCYPSGDFDERVKSHAARAGYAAAVFSPSHYDLCYLWDDPYAFERIMMWSGLAGWKFRALVRGWYTRVHRSVPRTLWRLGRTVRRFAGAHAD